MSMIPRPIMIASLLGGAVGVPYLASHGPKTGTDAPTASAAATSSPLTSVAAPLIASPAAAQAPLEQALPHLASYPKIEQVLRFDITKEWVYRQWARKSTWPTDVGLHGVRVQLVTGTQPSALAGSLTYFFNPHGQVEHISFHGRTGDPAPLAAFLAQTYELRPAASAAGEQIFRVMQGDRVKSEFRARPDAVTTGGAPNSAFALELELARPNSERLLPPRPTPFTAQPSPSTVPQTAAAANKAASTAGKGEESMIKKYFDKARFATPEEESQVIWRRWPN